jgi:hypothetical protein
MIFNTLFLYIVNILHLLLILFVIFVPFTNNLLLLLCHSLLIPFIMLHWLINNDTCAITEFEKLIRYKIGKPYSNTDCMSYKVIGPVYNFININANYSYYTWIFTLSLWIISITKIYYLFNKYNIYSQIFNKNK